ncbi:MAG: sigma-E factor negative regulatory protein [Burkholderiales bacterium]|nr:sigma-E factor negative regulatory protein [Burkholderiales bacterium]
MTKTNADLSDMMDGELSDAQIEQMLAQMNSDSSLRQSWDTYHLAADAISSDEFAFKLSDDFMANLSARLQQEPVVLAPKHSHTSSPAVPSAARLGSTLGATKSATKISWSLALTSIAATVMVALLMAPQIAPLLQGTQPSPSLVRNDTQDASFSAQIKVANNANSIANANSSTNASATNRDAEFAPRLENQVEMLRDPRLDSYLLAHQKASPTLDNGGRYIKRANVSATSDNEK